MSPEQARGDAIDPRSDLFSFGSVMYCMLAGRPPFRAESTYGILRRVTDDFPRSLREIQPDVPAWLEGIVMKLLSKDPDQRFANAELVAKLLEDCVAHLQQPAAISATRRSKTTSAIHTQNRKSNRHLFLSFGIALCCRACHRHVWAYFTSNQRHEGRSAKRNQRAGTSIDP